MQIISRVILNLSIVYFRTSSTAVIVLGILILITYCLQITKLEARVNHQHTIRKEMQILFEEEKASLIEQHKRDERALSDMEDRLNIIRRREQEIKDELSEV